MSIIDLSTSVEKLKTVEFSKWDRSRRWLARLNNWPWLQVVVGLAILSAILIPTNLLATQPFHHDEALYGTWALEIASGENPFLKHTPIDKPPLFLYTVAGAMSLLDATETTARLPSLLATGLTVGLSFWLGRKLYGPGTGLLAAWLVALSPLTIAFAPTAFTDPLLVALVLAACVAAAYGLAGWAGVWLGLAIVTKQQGLFFIPLVVGLLICFKVTGRQIVANLAQAPTKLHYLICNTRQLPDLRSTTARVRYYISRLTPDLIRMVAGVAAIVIPTLIWDASRLQIPGFWRQSLINYGNLSTTAASFGERWSGFTELLWYGTASPILNGIFLVGLPLLLLYGLWQAARLLGTGRQMVGEDQSAMTRYGWPKPDNLWSIPRSDSPEPTFSRRPEQRHPPVNIESIQPQRRMVRRVRSLHRPAPQPAAYQIVELTDASDSLRKIQIDWILSLFAGTFLLGHVLFSFQVWDRYLLGLIPFLALLLARVLLLPWSILKEQWLDRQPTLRSVGNVAVGLTLSLLLIWTLVSPVNDAANGRYPLGSNTNALQGIEQITAYLQGQVGADKTLHHRWLGTHWRFYLWDYPYDLQYWASPRMLATQAQPGHLIAFPTWQSETEARLVLAEAGLGLREMTRAYGPAGYPSIILYQIETR